MRRLREKYQVRKTYLRGDAVYGYKEWDWWSSNGCSASNPIQIIEIFQVSHIWDQTFMNSSLNIKALQFNEIFSKLLNKYIYIVPNLYELLFEYSKLYNFTKTFQTFLMNIYLYCPKPLWTPLWIFKALQFHEIFSKCFT